MRSPTRLHENLAFIENLKSINVPSLLKDMYAEKKLLIYRYIYKIIYPVMVLASLLMVGSFISFSTGVGILDVFVLIFKGAFGSLHGITETLARAAPMILTGTAAAFAMTCGFWNVGVEGQMIIGAIATTGIGLSFQGSSIVGIPIAILAGFLGGSVWGMLLAFIKTRFRVSEIIISIMMNWIALYVGYALITGPWAGKSPIAAGVVMTDFLNPSVHLPYLIPGTRFHAGIIISFICALSLYFVVQKTVFGFKLKVTGKNPTAARYAGININKTILFAMAISGGIAGLAGVVEIAGLFRYMRPDFSPGHGIFGLLMAFAVKGNIFLTTIGSFLFAALIIGTVSMRLIITIPPQIVQITLGITLICIIIADVIRTRLKVWIEK